MLAIRWLGTLVLGLYLSGLGSAAAQQYPIRDVRLIVPYAPGSTTDILARILAESVSKNIGQSVIVDNRPGANGIIGASVVANAAPDGYTLMIGAGLIHAALPFLVKDPPFDPRKNFSFITLLTETNQTLVVSSKLGVNSLDGLLKLAKSKPGQISYATPSASSKLSAQLLKLRANVEFREIPYTNPAHALNDVSNGDVSFMFSGTAPIQPFLAKGAVRALATTSLKRDEGNPNIPTLAESYPGFNVVGWLGLVGPAGMPKEIVDRLNSEFRKAISQSEVRSKLTAMDLMINTTDQVEFNRYIDADVKIWEEVSRRANWTPQ